MAILGLAGIVSAALAVVAPGSLRAEEQMNLAEQQISEAEKLFDRAQTSFEAGEYERAVELFGRAYELSLEPLLLFDIAQAYRLMGDCPNALLHYRRYLQHAKADVREGSAQETLRFALHHAVDLEIRCGQPPEPPGGMPEPRQPVTAKTNPEPARAPARRESTGLRALELGLAVAGSAALAAGIYYLVTDGDEQCTPGEKSPCVFRRDSARLGWSFVAGGSALLVGAATLVLWNRPGSTTVALDIGPRSFAVRGRF